MGSASARYSGMASPLLSPEVERLARRLAERVASVADAAPDVRRAATALILRPGTTGLELLLIQRAVFDGDPWSGQVALPGGRSDATDPSLVYTAIRETREETGLDLESGGHLLGPLDELHPRTPALPPIVVRPHVFALEADQPLAANREVAHAFWVPLAVLRDPATTRESRIRVRDAWWRVPSFVVEERVVWGMTERMLRQLLAL